MKQKIAKLVTTSALAGGAYLGGLNQNVGYQNLPSAIQEIALGKCIVELSPRVNYQDIPSAIQEAILVEHQVADSSITHAVDLFKSGNPMEAYEAFEVAKARVKQLKKLDPEYGSLEDAIFQYGAAIIDTNNIVKYHINYVYERVMKSPESIAKHITNGGNFDWTDSQLGNIGPETGAYHRLNGDEQAQNELLKYYVENVRRWGYVQEQMIGSLKKSPDKTNQIERAIKILDERMDQIQRERIWADDFEREHITER
jgi:hypothetical protein